MIFAYFIAAAYIYGFICCVRMIYNGDGLGFMGILFPPILLLFPGEYIYEDTEAICKWIKSKNWKWLTGTK